MLLSCELAGSLPTFAAAYANQTCPACGFADENNRNGRELACVSCQYGNHVDRNVGANMEGPECASPADRPSGAGWCRDMRHI
ncbi:MAG: transposase [Thaumarchaeota archaeon]|nr:transposase [Nitrososphaerota archaeon]